MALALFTFPEQSPEPFVSASELLVEIRRFITTLNPYVDSFNSLTLFTGYKEKTKQVHKTASDLFKKTVDYSQRSKRNRYNLLVNNDKDLKEYWSNLKSHVSKLLDNLVKFTKSEDPRDQLKIWTSLIEVMSDLSIIESHLQTRDQADKKV